ncbi:MAG TPA: xanthine dehydrogenase family protein molybdopterin-binding subunit [Ramlibacter sp.]|nr:xanthine dehydrogenase family protein molybdopterin-binding subunit [Ramlibacter sp.]
MTETTQIHPGGTGIGQSARRLEDRRFLTGRGQYIDDISLPRMAHGALVMSPYAHARIAAIDTSRALQAPGVLAVLTGKDLADADLGGMPPLFMPEDMGGPKGFRTYRPLLALDKVRCVGDRVAFVVAETAALARDAAELVDVEYEPLEAVTALEDAVREGAPLLWDEAPGNQCCMVMYGDAARTDAAFAGAPHVTSLRLESNRLSANSIEPRGAIGSFEPADGTYTLHTSSQNPHGARSMLCSYVFRMPETLLRVISPDVGGGFGMKADAYPEDGLVLWASRLCDGRPVKWVPSRSESLAGDNHGRDQVVHAEMALDRDGRILGVRARSMHAFGAYVVSAAVAPLNFAIRFIPSVYDVPAFHGSNVGIFTNTSPTGPYRGAGRPEAAYVMERLLDRAAADLGLEAAEIRRRNFIRPEQLPYATHTGFVYDSGDFPGLLERCLALSDARGYPQREAESRAKGLLRGRGIGFFIEQGGIFNDQMSLRFDPGGTVTILAGTHSHGQSHATVFAQLVSEWLGVPFEAVRYVQGDTDKVPFGRGTYAARSSMIGGCALKSAADQIVAQARPVAARLLGVEASELSYEAGVYSAQKGDKQVALRDVAKSFFIKAGPMAQLGAGLQATGSWNSDPPNFPNGCHLCEVEIDPDTGVVRIDGYNAVDDVGRALNPMVCKGQIMGGVAQGIGQALHEQVVYDRESGQLVTGSFMDYGMPRADDMPSFNLEFAEIPCTTNPLGVKAVGEAGTIGAPAAVMNAVLDALRPLGIRHLDMPATPLRVWQAIRAANDKR